MIEFVPIAAGPLVAGQTHKQQVAVFCQQKMRQAMDESSHPHLVDRQSYILLWELLLLLLRQNGTIVGTDIAELLLKDHEILRDPVVEASLFLFFFQLKFQFNFFFRLQHQVADAGGESAVIADRTLVSRHTEASVTKKFRELLLFGNKKEALEWAMTQGLWGHALFLASKMDQRTYSSVMIRFANGLALTDPLQTLYQLMSGWWLSCLHFLPNYFYITFLFSGRQPTAVTSCGDDKWGDWRPHLAMILSNSSAKSSGSDLDKKSIITLGDTLAARGFLLAAHFCYLVAQVDFGNYSNKASKLVLLSSSGSLPFDAFATSEAIQCTEVYEYARQLATPDFVIPSFQPYKFLYATRLAEHGQTVEALQYCEAVGTILARTPSNFSPALMSQVFELGSMLKFNDPQYLTENDGTTLGDPAWLTALETAVATAAASSSSSADGYVHENYAQDRQLNDQDAQTTTSEYPSSYQYGDQTQYNSYAQQQTSLQPDGSQYYDHQQTGQQESGAIAEQQESNNQYGSIQNQPQQDYGGYAQNYWPPTQPQQQQQPWSYDPNKAANGGSIDYNNWNQPNNNNAVGLVLYFIQRHEGARIF